jgi:hypothetical protein
MMARKIGASMVAVMLCMGLGLSAAAAQTADQEADQGRKDRARQECIQNGRWYEAATDTCEYESRAKTVLIDIERKECERNGGWFHVDTETCEMASRDEAEN